MLWPSNVFAAVRADTSTSCGIFFVFSGSCSYKQAYGTIIYTTEYDTVVYRPANKKQLLRVSLRFLFVGPMSGHFPIISDFTERLNRVLFVRTFRTSTYVLIFLLATAILKGCPLLRTRRGAWCWQLKRRLPPAASSNRLRRLAECSPFDASIIQREKKSTKWSIHIFVCTSSTIPSARTWCIS